VETNDDLSRRLDTSDAWIRQRTGIGQRHIADPGMATSDLAAEAGGRALKSAGSDAVDAVILTTTTPDRPCPATAPEIATRLGLPGVPAFDVAAVCTGFVYGMATAAGLIAGGIAERVLLIGADTYSSILNPDDRATVAVFGDGAGAVVLRAGDADEPGALGPFDLGSDGSGSDLIMIPGGGSRRSPGGATPTDRYFAMRGKEVFRHAVTQMSASAEAVLRRAGWTIDDVDRFVAHQANIRILDAVGTRLGIGRDRLAVHLDRVGNTGAASIPLALADAVTNGSLRPGHRVLLTAFGGGLTWGSVVLRWPDVEPA
jgi:3-oxoacyl-[acyl-carrier-protein] synthase-3